MSGGPLVINWQPSSFHGWGVFGLNLAYHAARSGRAMPVFLSPVNMDLIRPPDDWLDVLNPVFVASQQLNAQVDSQGLTEGATLNLPMFKGMGEDFMTPPDRSTVANHGVVFLERTVLSDGGRARADLLATVVAGATWLGDWLSSEGVARVVTVLQGVDTERFRRRETPPPDDGVFRVFSGGKLEYRKGQDLVIAAFKRFHQGHPDARLVFAWTNVFGIGPGDLATGGHVSTPPPAFGGREAEVSQWLVDNGVPAGAFENLGLVPNAVMPLVLPGIDVAVFPNRCEGGTNLVAMECMAAGVPVVLSANTGHLDLIRDGNCFQLETQRPVGWEPEDGGTEQWRESDVDEIVAALETAYADQADAHARGQRGAARMAPLTWEAQSMALLDAIGWPPAA